MDSVARLATKVERRWLRAKHAPSALPAIAAEELAQSGLHHGFDFSSILARVLRPTALPEASHAFEASLQSPVFPLFASERLAVDLHAYQPSTTTIHDHDFEGAIVNLEGTSVASTFAFDGAERVAEHVHRGELRLLRREPMPTGAVEPVHAGRRTIHRVTHMSPRTVMLVVRSRGPLGARAQRVYFEAGLAFRVFAPREPGRPSMHDARSGMLAFLAATDARAAHAFLLRLLAKSGAWSTATHLLESWEYLAETRDLERVLRGCRRRLGAWVDRLEDVHAEAKRAAAHATSRAGRPR